MIGRQFSTDGPICHAAAQVASWDRRHRIVLPRRQLIRRPGIIGPVILQNGEVIDAVLATRYEEVARIIMPAAEMRRDDKWSGTHAPKC